MSAKQASKVGSIATPTCFQVQACDAHEPVCIPVEQHCKDGRHLKGRSNVPWDAAGQATGCALMHGCAGAVSTPKAVQANSALLGPCCCCGCCADCACCW
jgi:hypothetical protein